MNFTFSTFVNVPAETIGIIGSEIEKNFIARLKKRGEFKAEHIDEIEFHINSAIRETMGDHSITADGYKLTTPQINGIAKQLKDNRRIYAIKDFREATGVGLKESRDFIDKFTVGSRGYIEFLSAFS